jgi:hypothetical protein
MGCFSLQPLIQSLYPISSQLTVCELVGTNTVYVLSQDVILDIVFIIPIRVFLPLHYSAIVCPVIFGLEWFDM